MAIRLLTLLLLFSLSGCDNNDAKKDDDSNTVKKDSELIKNLRAKSVEVLQIGNQKYFLKAALWRDFMPVSPPNGKPLISVNWLVSCDSTAIHSNILLAKQYVIFNDSVWISDYKKESASQPNNYKIEKTSVDGPKWRPNISVDVVAQVTDVNSNKDYFIVVKNQNIERTD